MRCTTKYVALDVRHATTVAAVRAETGRVIARGIVPTEAAALVEFFRGMPLQFRLHVGGGPAGAAAPRPPDARAESQSQPGAEGRVQRRGDSRHGMLERGMRAELARVTLTRKLASLTLRLWKTGERYDPTKLTIQAR